MAKKYQMPVRGLTADGIAVTIRELELGYLTQLAGWEGFEIAAGSILRKQALSLPDNCNSSFRRGMTSVWRIAPDRVLVHSDTTINFEVGDEIARLDLSHSRICMRLDGFGSASLLSRVVALDLSERSFPTGTFAQTSFHHVGVLIDRRDINVFNVFMPTTLAASLTDFLADHLNISA